MIRIQRIDGLFQHRNWNCLADEELTRDNHGLDRNLSDLTWRAAVPHQRRAKERVLARSRLYADAQYFIGEVQRSCARSPVDPVVLFDFGIAGQLHLKIKRQRLRNIRWLRVDPKDLLQSRPA